ncbi:MAG: hypothetical protein M3N52_07800 [Actinomycetota bacterium]|nr:hypothetical protein [Actinomycetota bacterium]
MTAPHAGTPVPAHGWTKAVAVGLAAGLVGAVAMAMFAMVAGATYLGSGFFTPMYHIASAFGWSTAMQAMMTSMEQAGSGSTFYWAAGPALTGLLIHMVAGMLWGGAFGLVVRGLRTTRAALVPVGIGFGLVVLLVMSYLVLPALASLFGSGEPIREMPAMVGWGTFATEHALFGLMLGLVALWLDAPIDGRTSSPARVRRRPDVPQRTA